MPKRFTVDCKEILPTDLVLDIRSVEEFEKGSLTEYNVPVIKQSDRGFCYRYTPLVFWVIGNGLLKNKDRICEFIETKCEGNHRVIVACSRGRLRSPIVWLYLKRKYTDMEFKVLRKGIKGYLENMKFK